MRRRDILYLGAALALSNSAAAQGAKAIRVGVLTTAPLSGLSRALGAFSGGVAIDRIEFVFSAEGGDHGLAWRAQRFDAAGLDGVLAIGDVAARSARTHITKAPVVFVVGSDPVKSGLVESLARPGGNLTGVTNQNIETNAKRIELISEAVPSLGRLGVIVNPASADVKETLETMLQMSRALGLHVSIHEAADLNAIAAAVQQAAASGARAIVPAANASYNAFATDMGRLMRSSKLAGVYSMKTFVEGGGLMSYGPDQLAIFTQAGSYLKRIVEGADPAHLPVERPAVMEMCIGMGTASLLGVKVPPSILVQASELLP